MLLYGANTPLNESNEDLRMKQYMVFIFDFWFLGDQVERAVHKVRRLRKKTGEAVTGQVKGKVPATSFLIDRSSLPGPHV